MTLKRRLDQLQRKTPEFYADVTEIPTPVLEAILRRAWKYGERTPAEAAIIRELNALGFEF